MRPGQENHQERSRDGIVHDIDEAGGCRMTNIAPRSHTSVQHLRLGIGRQTLGATRLTDRGCRVDIGMGMGMGGVNLTVHPHPSRTSEEPFDGVNLAVHPCASHARLTDVNREVHSITVQTCTTTSLKRFMKRLTKENDTMQERHGMRFGGGHDRSRHAGAAAGVCVMLALALSGLAPQTADAAVPPSNETDFGLELDGGTCGIDTITLSTWYEAMQFGIHGTVPDVVPVKSGYRFAGWVLAPDDARIVLHPGEECSVYGPWDESGTYRTLYALWTQGDGTAADPYSGFAEIPVDGSEVYVAVGTQIRIVSDTNLTGSVEAGLTVAPNVSYVGSLVSVAYGFVDAECTIMVDVGEGLTVHVVDASAVTKLVFASDPADGEVAYVGA